MYRFFFSLLVFLTTLQANSSEIDDLESILNDVTKLATKKSINVDYLPSVITVIHAQTFMNAGVQNVGEAIGMLPGIQMQINFLGQPVINIRGISLPDSMLSDKIKIFVDGVAINNEASGNSSFYMDFPIELIQRIEVLRGPGSTEYGASAFFGAINIITKLGSSNNDKQIFLGVGSYLYKTVSTNINTKSANWQLFSDGYYAKNEKSITNNERPTYPTSDEALNSLSVGFKATNGGFEFLTRYEETKSGNYFQYKDDIEPNHDKGRKESYFFSQLSYKTLINDFELETKAIFSNRESDISAYFSSDRASIAQAFSIVGVNMQDAFYARDHQVERNLEAKFTLKLPQIFSNDISIEGGIREAHLTTNYFYSSIENAIAQNVSTIETLPYDQVPFLYFPFKPISEPAYWEAPQSNALFRKTTRVITYAYIQDLISLNENTDLVLGARVDNYSDIGSHISSRAGLVYRPSEQFITKLLYGSAFRVPSFYERYTSGHIYYGYGVENLKPEKTDTYEVVFKYMPNLNNKFSLNAYYSKLMNVIDNDHSNDKYIGYVQMKDKVNKGVEFEYNFKMKETHNLFFNATYTDAEYTYPNLETTIDQNIPDTSKVMLKALYVYNPITPLSFGTAWRYYSPTVKNEFSENKYPNKITSVAQQHIIDETITYKLSTTSQVRATIKNIFDKEIHVPSKSYNAPGGELREGRNYFVNYTYLF